MNDDFIQKLDSIEIVEKLDCPEIDTELLNEDVPKKENPTSDNTNQTEIFCPKLNIPKSPWKEFMNTKESKQFDETLQTSLFSKSYFTYSNITEIDQETSKSIESKIVELNPLMLKSSTSLRNDPSAFVKEKSQFKTINQKTLVHPKKKKRDTAGKGWFDMPAPIITPDIELDLKAIQLRRNLNDDENEKGVKKFKKDKIPKYFQMGRIVEPANQFYSRRKRKDRKTTLIEEMIHDNENIVNKEYEKVKKKNLKRKRNHGGNFKKQKSRKRRKK